MKASKVSPSASETETETESPSPRAPAPLEIQPVKEEVKREVPKKPRLKKTRMKYSKLFEQVFDQLENEFLAQKAKLMEALHNDLVEMIGWHINQGVEVDTVCFVLDIIKYELTTEKLRQIYQGESIKKVMSTPISLGK